MNLPAEYHNIASYLLQVAILVLIGALLRRAFRIRVPRVLLIYWQALLLVSLLFPLFAPRRVFSTPPAYAPPVAQPVYGEAVAPSQEQLQTPGVDWSALKWRILIFAVAGICAVRIVRIFVGLRKLRLLRRRAHRLRSQLPGWESIELLRGGGEVLISGEIPGPATYGFFRSTILLPAQFEDMDPTSQRSILCHELIHVRRHDWLFAFSEQLVAALFWFHPAVWWLIHRIELAREQVVDREVLASSVDRRHYLKCLLYTAGGPAGLISANMFLARHHLKERVAFILEGVQMSKRQLVASVISAAVLFAAGAVVTNRAFPLTKTQALNPIADAAKPDVSTAPPTKAAQPPRPAVTAGQATTAPYAALRALQTARLHCPVSGTVLDSSGAVVTGVNISATDAQTQRPIATALTDERGNFLLEFPFEGTVDLTLDKRGFKPVAIKGVALRNNITASVKGTLLLLATRTAGEAQSQTPPATTAKPLSARGRVSGVVLDEDGLAIAGAAVRVTDPETQTVLATGVTSEQGTFGLEVAAQQGSVDFSFRAEGFKTNLIEGVRITESAPTAVRVTMKVAGATTSVMIRPTGTPALFVSPADLSGRARPAYFQGSAMPAYPTEALKQGIEATIMAEVMVEADGAVSAVRILKGHPLFDGAVTNAVKQWTYMPAILNERPRQSTNTATFVFKMQRP